MSKLNIEIRKTLSADKPFAVYLDGQLVQEFPTLTEARKHIQHNYALPRDPDRFFVQPAEDEIENDLTALKSLDIIAFNQGAEKSFVVIVSDFLKAEGPQPVSVVISEAAFELDISPATAKRYLVKHTARRAEFLVQDKLVRLRSHKIS